MDAHARDLGAARLLGTPERVDRDARTRLSHRTQSFGEFARGAAGNVRLLGPGVVEHFPVRHVGRGDGGEVLHERRRQGEIAGPHHADASLAGLYVDLVIIGRCQPRRSYHDADAAFDGRKHVFFDRCGRGVVDQHVGGRMKRVGDARRDHEAEVRAAERGPEITARAFARDGARERQVIGLEDGGHQGAAHPPGRAGDAQPYGHGRPPDRIGGARPRLRRSWIRGPRRCASGPRAQWRRCGARSGRPVRTVPRACRGRRRCRGRTWAGP